MSLYIDYPDKAGFAYGFNVEYPAIVEISIPIGWASYLKGFIIFCTSVCNIVWLITLSLNVYSWFLDGSSPKIKRKET